MSGLGFSILLRHEKSDRTHKDADLLFVHTLQLPENPLSSSEGGMPSTDSIGFGKGEGTTLQQHQRGCRTELSRRSNLICLVF